MTSKLRTDVSNAQQLARLPSDGNRYELIEGVLHVMTPAGFDHGDVAMRIGASLFQHVNQNSLGKVCAAETGFRIASNPDTVRAPDAAFVSQAQLDQCAGDESAYLPLAPSLVVEVVSPNDVFADVEAKAAQWLNAGSKVVLVANPEDQTLRVYRTSDKIEILRCGQVFEAGDGCPGWTLPVDDVFA